VISSGAELWFHTSYLTITSFLYTIGHPRNTQSKIPRDRSPRVDDSKLGGGDRGSDADPPLPVIVTLYRTHREMNDDVNSRACHGLG
jgi:hypothetical protein